MNTSVEGLMTMNNGYQTFEVPSDGTYEIEVAGARGGDGYCHGPGDGYVLRSDFTLQEGELLNIVVGQDRAE